MVRLEFNISDAFPAEDPVGHFVISLAAAMNDLIMTISRLCPPEHPKDSGLSAAEDMALFRQALGQIWETHLLVDAGLKDSKVKSFIERLGEEYTGGKLDGTTLLDLLMGEKGGTAKKHREVLRAARNSTFHYPKPGDGDLIDALEELEANGAQGVLVHERPMLSMRAEFADEVILRGSLGKVMDDEKAMRQLLADTAETIKAIIPLAQTAIRIWLDESGAAIRKTEE